MSPSRRAPKRTSGDRAAELRAHEEPLGPNVFAELGSLAGSARTLTRSL